MLLFFLAKESKNKKMELQPSQPIESVSGPDPLAGESLGGVVPSHEDMDTHNKIALLGRYIQLGTQIDPEASDRGAWEVAEQLITSSAPQPGEDMTSFITRLSAETAVSNPDLPTDVWGVMRQIRTLSRLEKLTDGGSSLEKEVAWREKLVGAGNVDQARDGVEKEVLMQEVKDLARGNVGVYTYVSSPTWRDWQKDMHDSGRQTVSPPAGGWSGVNEKYKFDGPLPGIDEQGYVPEGYKSEQGIKEYVVLMPHQKPVTEEVVTTTEVKKSFGRKTAVESKSTKVTGFQPETYQEFAGEGSQEPAVRVEYHFEGNSQWISDGVRPGRRLVVSFSLPESVASQLQSELQSDPKLIRTIAEGVLLDYGYPEETWKNGEKWGDKIVPAKPPYELTSPNHSLRILGVKPVLDANGRPNLEEHDIAVIPAA